MPDKTYSKGCFTKEDIKKQLAFLGVPQDRPVTVHTSLRAVGKVENGAEGFLAALTEHVTAKGGLLCIPTHTWHRCGDESLLTLDILSDDVCIGTLPRIASVLPGVHRSEHPTHSLAVFGESAKAEAFIAHDKEISSSSDPAGCLGQLERENGSILLIGVGQDKNTFIHVTEEMFGVKNRLSDNFYNATVKRADGSVITKPIRLIQPQGLGDVSQKYPKFEPAFHKNGCVRYGYTGGAFTRLCSARGLKETMETVLSRSGGEELLSDDKPLPPELYL